MATAAKKSSGGFQLFWQHDLTMESNLRRMSVSFEKTSIPFAKIDLRESQVNGARLNEAIIDRKVLDYMQGFRNLDVFPMPLVYKAPTGYVIVSGNQRCEAINRLIKEGELPKSVELDVYLLETDDGNLLDLIARVANVAHGEGSSVEERIQHAVHGVNVSGYSVQDMSKAFMVSENVIRAHKKAQEVREKLQRGGIEAHRLPVSSLESLAALDYDESIQAKLGSLVAQHQLPGERVRQAVSAIKKQKSTQGRLEQVKKVERECNSSAHSRNGHSSPAKPEGSKVPTKPRRDKAIRMLQGLVNFLEHDNVGESFTALDQLQITTKQDLDTFADLEKRLRFRMEVLCK